MMRTLVVLAGLLTVSAPAAAQGPLTLQAMAYAKSVRSTFARFPDAFLTVAGYRRLKGMGEPTTDQREAARAYCERRIGRFPLAAGGPMKVCTSVMTYVGRVTTDFAPRIPGELEKAAMVCWSRARMMIPEPIVAGMLSTFGIDLIWYRYSPGNLFTTDDVIVGVLEALDRYRPSVRREAVVAIHCSEYLISRYRFG